MMGESAAITVRRLRGLAAFADLDEDWERLVRHVGTTHPSASLAVVRAMFSHARGCSGEPEAWLAYRDGEPIAALVCTRERLRWGFADRQLRVPGDHDAYPLPLLVHADEPEVAVALLREAVSARSRALRLCLVRQSPPEFYTRVGALAPDLLLSHFDGGRGSVLLIPNSEEAFWNSLSSNFRKNLRKQRRRLEASSTVSWRFLRGAECSAQDIERFLTLESSGWKGEAGGSILRRPNVATYYRDVLASLARDGRLELHELLVDDRCLAVQMGVREGTVLNLLKIAYDESVSQLGPGNMLFLELVRREIASGQTSEIDCLTDMSWHRNWGMHQRVFLDVHVFPRTALALSVAFFPRAVIRWLKSRPLLTRALRSHRWPPADDPNSSSPG
jgi:CelD/BcsL family acetyltransferase involved in cellulose biosynthesis